MGGYRQGLGPADLAAGLTAAAVVLPKAMAYTTIAGLPVQVGIYTALVPMAVYALLVGAMLCGAALLRLGFIANFISESVLVGFKSGIGLVIVVDQLPKLLGLHVEKDGFFRDLAALFGDISQASIATLLLSAGLFTILFSLRRRWPSLPAPLIAWAWSWWAPCQGGFPPSAGPGWIC